MQHTAIVTVLACGLRRDTLRVAPLLGITHDRRWPKQVRMPGFPLYDEKGLTSIDAELDKFLNEGTPPIAFEPSATRRGATNARSPRGPIGTSGAWMTRARCSGMPREKGSEGS